MRIPWKTNVSRLTQVEQGLDGRYSAFGVVNGRMFVADGETLEEAQTERQVLKDSIFIRSMCDDMEELLEVMA